MKLRHIYFTLTSHVMQHSKMLTSSACSCHHYGSLFHCASTFIGWWGMLNLGLSTVSMAQESCNKRWVQSRPILVICHSDEWCQWQAWLQATPCHRHIPTLMVILQPSMALTKETSTATVLLLVSMPLQDNIMVLPLCMVLQTLSVLLISHMAVNNIPLLTRGMVLVPLPMAHM